MSTGTAGQAATLGPVSVLSDTINVSLHSLLFFFFTKQQLSEVLIVSLVHGYHKTTNSEFFANKYFIELLDKSQTGRRDIWCKR